MLQLRTVSGHGHLKKVEITFMKLGMMTKECDISYPPTLERTVWGTDAHMHVICVCVCVSVYAFASQENRLSSCTRGQCSCIVLMIIIFP